MLEILYVRHSVVCKSKSDCFAILCLFKFYTLYYQKTTFSVRVIRKFRSCVLWSMKSITWSTSLCFARGSWNWNIKRKHIKWWTLEESHKIFIQTHRQFPYHTAVWSRLPSNRLQSNKSLASTSFINLNYCFNTHIPSALDNTSAWI